jgi:hypothetical protein
VQRAVCAACEGHFVAAEVALRSLRQGHALNGVTQTTKVMTQRRHRRKWVAVLAALVVDRSCRHRNA